MLFQAFSSSWSEILALEVYIKIWYMDSRILRIPTSEIKWNTILSEPVQDWKKIYIIPLKCCLSTKLRYFQFRILHRILGVNKYLHSIGISDSNLCTFCSSSVESISHLFWECPVTHQFIQDLQTSILNNEVLLNKNAFLFGFPDGRRSSFNFVILYAKYFIFTAKCKQERLSINSFKNMLKRV